MSWWSKVKRGWKRIDRADLWPSTLPRIPARTERPPHSTTSSSCERSSFARPLLSTMKSCRWSSGLLWLEIGVKSVASKSLPRTRLSLVSNDTGREATQETSVLDRD